MKPRRFTVGSNVYYSTRQKYVTEIDLYPGNIVFYKKLGKKYIKLSNVIPNEVGEYIVDSVLSELDLSGRTKKVKDNIQALKYLTTISKENIDLIKIAMTLGG